MKANTISSLILSLVIISLSTSITPINFSYYDPYSCDKKFVKTVIANGMIVTGLDNNPAFLGEILIHKDGRIIKIFRQKEVLSLEKLKEQFPLSDIYNAEGQIVMPGGIDPHVHLEYPQGSHPIESSDDFYTGSVAALCGGTTTFLDFIEADRKKKEPLAEALVKRRNVAKEKSILDFSFHMTLNYYDDNTIEQQIRDIIELYGINSFKIYTAYDNIKLNDAQIELCFEILKKYGGLPIIHSELDLLIKHRTMLCQNKNLTAAEYQAYCHPTIGEDDQIEKLIEIAKKVNLRQGMHIVHVTSKNSLPMFEKAQKEGMKLTGEVCPQHLALTDEVYKRANGADFICSPPMRPQEDVDGMWEGIQNNLLDFVVTDHCPFTTRQRRGQRKTPEFRNKYDEKTGDAIRVKQPESKDQQWWKKDSDVPFFNMPGGVPGIETRLFVTYQKGVVEKKISLEKFVQLVSTNTAKRYKLYPKKGVLISGSDADILIIDPNKKTVLKQETLHQNVDFCPYEGMQVDMKIKSIFLRGEKVFDDYKLLPNALKRRGRYLTRKSFNG